MPDQKRTYKVVVLEDKRTRVLYVEADQIRVTESGVLVFYERGLARHTLPNRIIEAYAPGTWTHVVEGEVEEEVDDEDDGFNRACEEDEKDFLRQEEND